VDNNVLLGVEFEPHDLAELLIDPDSELLGGGRRDRSGVLLGMVMPFVRAAFGDYTRRYHPDRFARYQSKEARTYASEIFILIRDAYRKLGTAKARARTVEALRQRSTPTRGTRHTTARPPPRSAPAPLVNEKKSGPIISGPPQGPAFTPRPAGTPPVGAPIHPPAQRHGETQASFIGDGALRHRF